MNKGYIVFKCLVCDKVTIVVNSQYDDSIEAERYMSCAHDGRHRDLIAIGKFKIDKDRYKNIGECMQHDSYKKVKGRIRQR